VTWDRTSSDDRQLRVLHIITSLDPGGAERQIELLLSRSSNDVSVVCLYFRGAIGDKIVADGGRVQLLGMAGWRKLTAVPRLARMLKAIEPDVVNVHLLSAQSFGMLAARLAKVPVVVSSEHSLMAHSIEGRPLSPWLRALYLVLARLSDRVVAVSTTTRCRLEHWGVPADRIVVIDNGVDFRSARYAPEFRPTARRFLGVDDQSQIIGAVGRLVPVKRFDVLLRAAGPILEPLDAHLVIVGDGPDRENLVALAHELSVGDRVHFPGQQLRACRLLNAFDLFVSPSRDETFGVAILESVANGLPTIYEQCPALDDIAMTSDWIVRLDDDTADDELVLRQTIEAELRKGPVRHPVPNALSLRYGGDRLARSYDELHLELSRIKAASAGRSRRQRSIGDLKEKVKSRVGVAGVG
jgi:glycosyltransferase involved in cell wall biosynthesis